LVLVVDEVEAEEEHTIDRRLHFGPDLIAEKSDDGVVAKGEDGELVATLFDASGISVEISLARGVEEPRMDGWTFPRDLKAVPSDTATLRCRISTGLLVHGLAMTPSVPERVAARREDDRMVIEISGEQDSSEVQVGQSGTELSVAAVGAARLSDS
jgi:hypothetical protein